MKNPTGFPTVFSTLAVSFALALTVHAADSSGLDSLQGSWTTKRTNQEGQVLSQVLEIKNDRLTFKLMSAEGELRFVAKGTASTQKLGPFQTLKITDIKAGQSEDSAETVDDERASVFLLDGDTLTLASNFDKVRANQPPRADIYARGKSAAKPPEDAAAKLAGTWKMDVHINDNDADYQLRFAQAEGKLSATLISPRSGEHKFRKVTWEDEKLAMELDREFEGNTVTLLYTGKMEGDGLSGKVVAKGAEDQFSGTWKAKK
jgi:hypothetical protein